MNFLLSALVIVAALTTAIHAAKHPREHTFSLTDDGLSIDEEFHPFSSMQSFAALEDIEGDLPPVLSIKTDNWLAPHLVIPLIDVDVDGVYAHFLERVEEVAHETSFADVVAAWLGF